MTKFAIVGFGHIGKRHAEHILANPDARLVAVCDIDASVQELLLHKSITFYTDYKQMLTSESIDVVCICTPNYLHEPHSILASEKGMHSVVEKPMALSEAACERMIVAAEQNSTLLFAVKQNRYNAPVDLVKQLMNSGELGQVFMVQVNCFWNRSEAYYQQSAWRGTKQMDGGCLFTQFSHFVDILYYLNGDIETIKGQIANFAHQHNTEFEDTGSFVMQATNGSIVNFNFTSCSYDKNMEGSITIFAEKGTVKIGGQYLNTVEYQCLQGEALPQVNISSKENDYGLYKGSMSNHDKMIQNVIDVLEHQGVIMTTAKEGMDVVRIIEQMYQAAE